MTQTDRVVVGFARWVLRPMTLVTVFLSLMKGRVLLAAAAAVVLFAIVGVSHMIISSDGWPDESAD